MSKASRTYAGWGVLIALTIVATLAAAAWWQIRSASTVAASSWLQTGQRVAELIRDENLREVGARSERLAGNPAFVGYIAQALGTGAAPDAMVDIASVSDLLSERKMEFAFDTLAVLDVNGRVLVSTDNGPQAKSDLSNDVLVAKARDTLAPAIGPWIDEGRIRLVAVAPLLRGDALEGLLLTGTIINDTFAGKIASASGTEVALVVLPPYGNQIVASTLGSARAQQLRSQLDSLPAADVSAETQSQAIMPIRLGDDSLHARVTPLFGSSGGAAMILLIPPQRAGGFVRAIGSPMGAAAALLLTGLLLGLVTVWRAWLRPVHALLATSELASRGDYRKDAPVSGTGAVAQISVGFNILLNKLRRLTTPVGRTSPVAPSSPKGTP